MHVFVELGTRLKRGVDFNSDCINSRWQSSGDKRSIHWAALNVFDGHERGADDGRSTDDAGGIGMQDDAHVRRSALPCIVKKLEREYDGVMRCHHEKYDRPRRSKPPELLHWMVGSSGEVRAGCASILAGSPPFSRP